MQRRSQHTYALPSSRASPQSENSPQSAPPSPRSGILLRNPVQYGSSVDHPLAYRHSANSSSSLPSTPSANPPGSLNQSPHSQRSEPLNYTSIDWSLIAIQRPQIRSKYIVTLLHRPSASLYTWPIDPQKPPVQGTCFVTRLDPGANQNTPSNSILRQSFRLLEDCLRAWIRHIRSRPRSSSPGNNGCVVVRDDEIDRITTQLQLSFTTGDERADYLSRQNIPDAIPNSNPTSPVTTPKMFPTDVKQSAEMLNSTRSADTNISPPTSRSSRRSLSPSSVVSRVSKLSLSLPPAQEETSAEISGTGTPAVLVTESSPSIDQQPTW
ncbi:hypothetical protein MPSI1_000345 [Malassezia psittaci]|uniref:Inheritance of peroxisomes protein 1 n=1 Tax=Malassezia psittaci TaxID=1821823 RepID=A0AAF0F798_9BASI|nr:hypothetical protein MPSI1_000345 [Malassezia psittaci]